MLQRSKTTTTNTGKNREIQGKTAVNNNSNDRLQNSVNNNSKDRLLCKICTYLLKLYADSTLAFYSVYSTANYGKRCSTRDTRVTARWVI
eukprot:scaffold53580_cov65-Phaeocystis_antarctica.AAC.12